MLPRARKDKLMVRALPDETLIYDLERHKVHCLNRASALVWQHCDGQHDLPALAALLERELRVGNGAAVAQLALEQLGRRQLLQEALAPLPDVERLSRRQALKALAAAAVLPLVMTLAAPKVAWAQGPGLECARLGGPHNSLVIVNPDGTPCAPGKFCRNGVCIAPSTAEGTPLTAGAQAGQPCTGTGQGNCPAGCSCISTGGGPVICHC